MQVSAGTMRERIFEVSGSSKKLPGKITCRCKSMNITEKKHERMTEFKSEEIPVEIRFYTIADLQKMLGWSYTTVNKLFEDPNFPSADFGKSKVVEAHALIDYFSTKHVKKRERHWRT